VSSKSPIFCSPANISRRFKETHHLHLQDGRLSHWRNQHAAGSKQSSLLHAGFFSGLIFVPVMETTCSSQTSVDFRWPTRAAVPEDRTLRRHRSDNIKSNNVSIHN
jgi:hypothetical protein